MKTAKSFSEYKLNLQRGSSDQNNTDFTDVITLDPKTPTILKSVAETNPRRSTIETIHTLNRESQSWLRSELVAD